MLVASLLLLLLPAPAEAGKKVRLAYKAHPGESVDWQVSIAGDGSIYTRAMGRAQEAPPLVVVGVHLRRAAAAATFPIFATRSRFLSSTGSLIASFFSYLSILLSEAVLLHASACQASPDSVHLLGPPNTRQKIRFLQEFLE